MGEIENRISGIYNDCWKIYKDYLRGYDMDRYNQQAQELIKKYGCESDIKDMIIWFSPKINKLHDIYVKGVNNK